MEDGLRSLFWFYESKAWYFEGEEAFNSAAKALSNPGDVDEEKIEHLEFLISNLRVRQAWFLSRQSRYKEAQNILEARQVWFAFRQAGTEDPETALPTLVESTLAEKDPEGLWVNAGVEVNTLYGQGNYEAARHFLEWYDEHFRSWPWAKAQTNANLGRIAGALGDYEKARQLLQEALEILRPLGDQVSVMLYLHTLGGILRILGDAGEARQLFQESLDLAEAHNYPMGKVLALGDLGNLAYAEGEYKSAKDYFDSSQILSEEIGDNRGRALALTNLGRVATVLGEYDEARRLFEQGLPITAQSGNRRGTALTLNRLSGVHLQMGDLDKAETLCQESWEICQELGYRKGAILAQITHGEIALEREEFRPAGVFFQGSLENSENMGFVLGIMRSEIGLGRTAFGIGDLKQAECHLWRGLVIGGESRQQRTELSALLTLAEILIAAGEPKKGVELSSLAASHPAADHQTMEKANSELEMLKSNLTPAEFTTLVAHGWELTLDAVRETHIDPN